jgi:hypothetical protein
MRRLIALAAGLLVSMPIMAEVQTITITPPTQKVDGTPLDLTLIKSTRLQCGLGAASPAPGGWIINDEIPMPSTTKNYDFIPNGQWNCHAWVLSTYSCASMQTPDGAWTFGTDFDPLAGNEILLNGNDVSGEGVLLVNINGVTWAQASSTPVTWWQYGATTGWVMMPAPQIPPGAPQLTPTTAPLCQSGDTPDLVFTIPMNTPTRSTNSKPGVPGIAISKHGATNSGPVTSTSNSTTTTTTTTH